jgi:hypothetical protein
MIKKPHYIGLDEARQLLAEIGVALSPRQMKRAADMDARGRRKLPFFLDPIDGRLKIEKGTLVRIYRDLQMKAENEIKYEKTGACLPRGRWGAPGQCADRPGDPYCCAGHSKVAGHLRERRAQRAGARN